MILQQETFEKFGYWPKDLVRRDIRPVLLMCKSCNLHFCVKNRTARNYIANRKRKPVCRACTSKLVGSIVANKRMANTDIGLNSVKKIQITPLLWLTMFRSYSIFKNNKKRVRVQKSGYSISVVESGAILASLGYKGQEINTEYFKNVILINFLKQQNTHFKFELMNLLFKDHLHKQDFSSNYCVLYLKYDKYKAIFDLIPHLNVEPDCHGTRVRSGSLYIDGGWIHIG